MELRKAVRIGDKPIVPIQILTAATLAVTAVPTTATTTTVAAATASTTITTTTTATPIAPPDTATLVELPILQPTKIKEEPKLPDTQTPIKKYYGRKRDGQSSSSEDDLNYEEAESTEKNKYGSQMFDFFFQFGRFIFKTELFLSFCVFVSDPIR